MRLILSCTGVLVVGVTSVARERGRERERERVCVLPASSAPRPCVPPLSTSCVNVNVSQHEPEREPPWKALDNPFYRYKEMPSCTTGCSYVLMWLAGECLEPCRSTAVGAAWILLTLSCFRRGFESNRRHGRTRGTIITYCRSNLRWDTDLVPS
jgi:hypothetical protein